MALRFTETNKWKDDWYLSLSNDYRIVWQYILDNCSIAGLWQKGFKAMNYFCGTQITEQEFQTVFKNRVYETGNSYFIPKFLKVQYPSGITSDKPLIISVRNELEKFNLYPIIKESLPNDYPIIKVRVRERETGKGEGKQVKVTGEVKGGLGEKPKKHLFVNSEFYELSKFTEAIEKDEKYICYDMAFYHESVKNWSANGNARIDWIATAKNFMLGDTREGKAKLKPEYQQLQQTNKFKNNGRNNFTDEELAAAFARNIAKTGGAGTVPGR